MLSLFACGDLQLNIASAVHLLVVFWKFLIGAVDDNVKVFPAKWRFAFWMRNTVSLEPSQQKRERLESKNLPLVQVPMAILVFPT
jgi:hypothetical protein